VNPTNIKTRITLYIVVLLALHFFSQIIDPLFASASLIAYIAAAFNGVFTVESYYLIRDLKGFTFIKVFWMIYGVRLMMLFFFIIVYGALQERVVMNRFFAVFFLNYFVWITLEIVVLVKERNAEREKRFSKF
jgi:hypothetical protein